MKAIDQQIASMREEIERLQAISNEYDRLQASGPVSVWYVGCSENNSGGRYWMSENDYAGLEMSGWTIDRSQRSFYKAFTAASEAIAEDMGKASFNESTDQYADSEGCICCGRPFRFDSVESPDKLWFVDLDPEYAWPKLPLPK